MPHSPLLDRILPIRLLALDVDGVLTDGRITLSSDGVETKSFHVRDGLGLQMWRQRGGVAALISGRPFALLERRAQEMGVEHVHMGVACKERVLREVLERHGWDGSAACAVGDDLPDLAMFRAAGLRVCVADAAPELKDVADHVTRAEGGCGAVREVVEWLLRAQGKWLGVE